MKKVVGLILVALLVISFISIGLADVGDDCEDDSDCDSGEVCVDDECVVEEEETEESLDNIEKAYNCLGEKVEEKDDCEDLVLEEQIFALLALAHDSSLQSNCKSEIMDKSKKDKCWPESGCEIKETAQALLALDRVGKSTNDIEKWLIENNNTADLIWYLEIEADDVADCEINGNSFRIGEDKKLSRNAGTCLTLSEDDYWFKIKDSCHDETFEITCDEDFKAALLYRKPGEDIDTIYVSNQHEETVADGEIEIFVNAFCFSTGKTCDYEGSLWAALALAKAGRSVSPYIPYLMAFAEDNERYFPETFLYILTSYDEYYNGILQQQKSSGYFQAENSAYNKLYDTALALLALESNDGAEDYLIEVQGDDGCFDGIRDTAFLLYAGWPKTAVVGGDVDRDYCTSYNYYCVSPGDCSQEDTLDNYYCSGSNVCCKTEPELKSCSELEGYLCDSDERCDGTALDSSDSKICCDEECVDKGALSGCESAGYICYIGTNCPDGWERAAYDCDYDEVCCKEGSGGFWWIWLIILVILVGLVVLGIIYRHKLRAWLFKLKNKFKKGKGAIGTTGPPTGPGPPIMPSGRIMPRRIIPRGRPVPRRLPKKTGLDKELDETLKKLKEIGK